MQGLVVSCVWLCAFGRPNGPGAPLHWPAYNASSDTNLNISLPLSVTTGLRAVQCDFWDAVMRNVSSSTP